MVNNHLTNFAIWGHWGSYLAFFKSKIGFGKDYFLYFHQKKSGRNTLICNSVGKMYNNLVLTPTRAVQLFIESRKTGASISPEITSVIKTYRKWRENELIGLLNASGYYPEIFHEDGMEDTIHRLLASFKAKHVPHKFTT
ncbi:MAG: hypothetical protein MH321_02795 [Leptospiraceae bacterium]|nr:hypothetical protein [Leptospiraceae bacterium]